ncbi:MAG: hypothetical protein ACQGQP_04780 [Desulfovibrio sp.]|nr:hypothetical protein [Mailhella sp.]
MESAVVELVAQQKAQFPGRHIQQERSLCHMPRPVGHQSAQKIKMAGFSGINARKDKQHEKAAGKNEYEPGEHGFRVKTLQDLSCKRPCS